MPITTTTDTFTRADSSSLGLTETGNAGWEELLGDWQIVSGRLTPVASAAGQFAVANVRGVDHTVSVDVVTGTGQGGSGHAYVVARSASVGDCLVAGWQQGTGDVTLYKAIGNAYTLMQTVVGSTHGGRIGIKAIGDGVTVYLNGSAIMTYTITDAVLRTGTKIGVLTSDTAAFDNLSVETYVPSGGVPWITIAPTPAFAPDQLSGLQVWLKAYAITGKSDSDAVSTWTDSSGGGHNFTEATNTPTYRTNIKNGLPTVRFADGTSQILSGGDLSALFTTGASVFAAANGSNGFNKQMVYEHQAIDSWWQFGANGNFGPFRSARLETTGVFSNGWHVWSVTADNGSNYKVWLDGVNKINDTAGFTFQGGTSHVIGRQRVNNETDSQDIGEIVIYNRVLSDTDRARVETYLNTTWVIF